MFKTLIPKMLQKLAFTRIDLRQFSILSGGQLVKHFWYNILLLLTFCSLLRAEEAEEIVVSPKKKYAISICSFFKNEAKYLREWIEYHTLIGVDHFYLYDNGSRDRSFEVLLPFIKKGLVTCVYWPDRMPYHQEENEEGLSSWALSTKLPAYENAVKYQALDETEWLIPLDVDEYLVPVRANCLNDVLKHYQKHSGLELKSYFFDGSQTELFPRKELLISSVGLTRKPLEKAQKIITKTLFKPKDQVGFTWPPYQCVFKKDCSVPIIHQNELRINKYVNRYKGVLHFDKKKEKLRVDSRLLYESEICELLEIGFEIEDQEKAISRFEPELRKRMGLETEWKW